MATLEEYINMGYNGYYALYDDTINILSSISTKKIKPTDEQMDKVIDKIIKHKKIEIMTRYPTNILENLFAIKTLNSNQIEKVLDYFKSLMDKKKIYNYVNCQLWMLSLFGNPNTTKQIYLKLINLPIYKTDTIVMSLINAIPKYIKSKDIDEIIELYKLISNNISHSYLLMEIIERIFKRKEEGDEDTVFPKNGMGNFLKIPDKKNKINKKDIKKIIEIMQGKCIDKIYGLIKTHKIKMNLLKELVKYEYIYEGLEKIIKDFSNEEIGSFLEVYLENFKNSKNRLMINENILRINEIIIKNIDYIKNINSTVLNCFIEGNNLFQLRQLLNRESINIPRKELVELTKAICKKGNLEIWNLFKSKNLLELTEDCYDITISNEGNCEIINELIDFKIIPNIKTLTKLPSNYYGQKVFNIIKESYLISITTRLIKLLLSKNIIVSGIRDYISKENIDDLYKICHDINRFPPEYESYLKENISKEVLEFRRMFLSHSIEYIEKKIKEGMQIDQYCYDNLFLNYYYRGIKQYIEQNYKDKFILSLDGIMRIENKILKSEEYEIYKINNNL